MFILLRKIAPFIHLKGNSEINADKQAAKLKKSESNCFKYNKMP